MASLQTPQWLESLSKTLPGYLQTLAVSEQPGRFRACLHGETRLGKRVALGFSCFALKLYYILGLWKQLPPETQQVWIQFIKSYQVDECTLPEAFTQNAFLDPAVIYDSYDYWHYPAQLLFHSYPYIRQPRRLWQCIRHNRRLVERQQIVMAETKQAIATLTEVGQAATQPYRGFPATPPDLTVYLSSLDWTMPWQAGGQAATQAVFIHKEAPQFLDPDGVQDLKATYQRFLENLAHQETGAYFKERLPAHGQLINGAMKVLSALAWLDIPIHFPERLIDTCLTKQPDPDGCHLVDAVFVLYRCLQQTDYKRADIQRYLRQVLEMIKPHYNPDGGFSYHIGRSQQGYYGVLISRGLPESDIHGTVLLTWAIAMILEILESNKFAWRVIKP